MPVITSESARSANLRRGLPDLAGTPGQIEHAEEIRHDHFTAIERYLDGLRADHRNLQSLIRTNPDVAHDAAATYAEWLEGCQRVKVLRLKATARWWLIRRHASVHTLLEEGAGVR